MRIVLIGTRGVPAAYSGFETLVEAVGQRLAARGHDVTVYCRPHMVEGRYATYKGMRLVYLPTIANKYLDTIVHTLVCTLHMGFVRRPDVAVYFIAGNSPLTVLGRLLGIPSIINVDGLDSRRAKWNGPAKTYLRWAERNAPRFADATITDSRSVQELYLREWGAETHFIPYGSELEGEDTGEHLARLGLEPKKYILFVGRLVPENNAHVLVEAFEGLDTDLRLVVVGDAPYMEEYHASLHATKDERVVFPGYVYGDGYRELIRNAALFVAPTEVGSTHPVITEAMAAGNCVVVNDYEPNLETIGDAGLSYPGKEGAPGLRRVLAELLTDPDKIARYGELARERARAVYSWDAVTTAYEDLARAVASRRRSLGAALKRRTQP
jgi:glycosyltransferase involved in cell wall biosynthesis